MKNNIEETEKKLFDEIQVMVEELPWGYKLNLEYFDACIHEAGHGVAVLVSNTKLNIHKCILEVYPNRHGDRIEGKTIYPPSPRKTSFPIFSTLPVFLRKVIDASGAILTDEFYNYFYGWNKVRNVDDLMSTYGAFSDFYKGCSFGSLGFYSAIFLTRCSYKSHSIRLLHLRLIRDLLKSNGKLVINNLEVYVKQREKEL